MKTVEIGTVSSEIELQEVLAAANTEDQVLVATEFLTSVARMEGAGFAKEAKRWRGTTDPSVKVFSASTVNPGEDALWAAIDIGPDDKSITLLKITNTYSGGNREHDELLADALHRMKHGTLK